MKNIKTGVIFFYFEVIVCYCIKIFLKVLMWTLVVVLTFKLL